MAHAILVSRDFCGNEREAAIECAHDLGRKATAAELREAFAIAEQWWRASQRAAGVTAPIEPEERAAITRMMERA